ncbi:ArsR family transcriptional regulator [Pseudomonas cerasi]|nr:ArsR family transcriptional regulator [Pseudomonas cerasi]MDA7011511.1 ArsR family transcriptional regulator [Pseudomonas cerasi]
MSASIITSLSGPLNKVRTLSRSVYICLDWSERTPHIGGALGAALLELMLKGGWVSHHLDSRALKLTPKEAGGMAEAFGV